MFTSDFSHFHCVVVRILKTAYKWHKAQTCKLCKMYTKGKRERLFLVDSCRSLSQLAWKKISAAP